MVIHLFWSGPWSFVGYLGLVLVFVGWCVVGGGRFNRCLLGFFCYYWRGVHFFLGAGWFSFFSGGGGGAGLSFYGV